MKSPIAEIIRQRRTIHQFESDRLPSEEDILSAIEHAVWAPNHYVSEPWHFYLLGPETKEKICALNAELVKSVRGEEAGEIKLKRWREIPGWLLLTCSYSRNALREREDYAACCCAAQNLMLYLWDIGIGMKWTTGGVIRDKRFQDIIGLDPEHESVVGLFWYGYPKEVPQVSRKPIEDKLSYLP